MVDLYSKWRQSYLQRVLYKLRVCIFYAIAQLGVGTFGTGRNILDFFAYSSPKKFPCALHNPYTHRVLFRLAVSRNCLWGDKNFSGLPSAHKFNFCGWGQAPACNSGESVCFALTGRKFESRTLRTFTIAFQPSSDVYFAGLKFVIHLYDVLLDLPSSLVLYERSVCIQTSCKFHLRHFPICDVLLSAWLYTVYTWISWHLRISMVNVVFLCFPSFDLHSSLRLGKDIEATVI